MPMIMVEKDNCKGCGICVEICPKACLDISEDFNSFGSRYCIQTDAGKCIGCKLCGIMCPDSAISVFR